MIEEELRERIDRLLDDETLPDWTDVAARAPAVSSSRRHPHGIRSLVAAAVLGAAIAAAPALALSTPLRELVGLRSTPDPVLVARLTGAFAHGPQAPWGTSIKATFTIGERGKPRGTGVPNGSVFMVTLVGKSGTSSPFFTAFGSDGRYSATTRVPRGRIADIQIFGFLNVPGRSPLANRPIPVIVVNNPY